MPENETNVPASIRQIHIAGSDETFIVFNTEKIVIGTEGEDGAVFLRFDVLDGELTLTHAESDGDVEANPL